VSRGGQRRAYLAGGLGLAAAAVWRVRTWANRWNATGEEVRRRLDGDELVPNARMQTTRAVTIRARRDRVFPWLAQLGQDRGGFYSYDFLENRLGLNVHSADRILPEFQHIRVGDGIAVAPGPPFYGFRVADVAPPTRLVLEMRMHPFTGQEQDADTESPSLHATWSFTLEPLGDGSTRLITRTRAHIGLPAGLRQLYQILLEMSEFAMERRMLVGIRERAERAAEVSQL